MLRTLDEGIMPKKSATELQNDPVDSANESAGEPDLCLVGNIKKAKPNNPDWKGTHLFNRGQRVYLLDGKGRRIRVLGRHRQKGRFLISWISSKHTENWRVQTTLKPIVVENLCYPGFRFKGIDLNDVEKSLNERGEWPYR